MNYLHSLLGLPLLLLLLPQFWVPTRAEERDVVVLAPPGVHGSLGDTVILPCNLQPVESEILRVKQIRWERLEPWGGLSTVAEFDWVQGPSIPEPGHVQFVAAGKNQDLLDASLTLTELHLDDEANYTCEVTTFHHGSGRASTWLQVFYAPQVSISQLDEIGQKGLKETSLSCYADSKPEHSGYEWSTIMGPLPPSAVPQGPRLLLQSSEETIDTTFICRVSNAVGTGQATLKVQLPGSPMANLVPRILTNVGLVLIGMACGLLIAVQMYNQVFRRKRMSSIHRPQNSLRTPRTRIPPGPTPGNMSPPNECGADSCHVIEHPET